MGLDRTEHQSKSQGAFPLTQETVHSAEKILGGTPSHRNSRARCPCHQSL
jgi:hypothetical protein